MLKKNTAVYDTIKAIIFAVFAIYVQLREVAVLDTFTGNRIVTAGILLVGLVVIFADAFVTRTCFRNRKTDLLFVFLCFTALSCLINFRYGLGDNVKALCEMVLFFFMLFPAVSTYEKERKQKLFNIVLTTVCITWFILCSVSIGMYLFSVEYYIGGGSWGASNQGFSSLYQRLWGIFQDQNYAGFVSVAVIIAGLYFIKTAKKKAVAVILNVISILTQLTFITLSGSRSVIVVLACAMAVYMLYFTAVFFKEKKAHLIFQGATAVAVAALFIGLIEAGTYVLPYAQKVVEALPDGVQSAVVSVYDTVYEKSELELLTEQEFFARISNASASQSTNTNTTQPTGEPTTAEEEDDDGVNRLHRTDIAGMNGDISNGRFTRWKDALSLFLKAPVFGTSPRNMSTFAKEHNPDTLMAKYGIASHNGYIDIITGTGVVGTIAFALFFILTLVSVIKKYFRFENEDDFAASTAIAFAFSLSAIFVSDLFFIITIGAFMFWFNLGYASSCTDGADKGGLLDKLFTKINTLIDKVLNKGRKA